LFEAYPFKASAAELKASPAEPSLIPGSARWIYRLALARPLRSTLTSAMLPSSVSRRLWKYRATSRPHEACGSCTGVIETSNFRPSQTPVSFGFGDTLTNSAEADEKVFPFYLDPCHAADRCRHGPSARPSSRESGGRAVNHLRPARTSAGFRRSCRVLGPLANAGTRASGHGGHVGASATSQLDGSPRMWDGSVSSRPDLLATLPEIKGSSPVSRRTGVCRESVLLPEAGAIFCGCRARRWKGLL
jgi:hypothetical protein